MVYTSVADVHEGFSRNCDFPPEHDFFFFPSCSTKQEWYKLICMDREKGLQKVDSLRKEKEALEMAECTFRPELYGRGNKSSKVMTFKAMVKSYGTWLPKPPDCRLLQGLNENFFQKNTIEN